jgi:hypothetical protein
MNSLYLRRLTVKTHPIPDFDLLPGLIEEGHRYPILERSTGRFQGLYQCRGASLDELWREFVGLPGDSRR